MKTTTTINSMSKAEEILKASKGANPSFITIEPSMIAEAIQAGDLVKIAERKGHKGGNNIYYKCNKAGGNNILMHVKYNMYTVFSRMVYCEKLNKLIDVIPTLEQFSFYSGLTNRNRCKIMASTPSELQKQGFSATLYLPRVLTSLEIYGELRNLDSTFDVHHKGDCWDNRQNMTMYIPSSIHKHRNNHMTGRYIGFYTEFQELCKSLRKKYNELHKETEIA